MNAQDFLTHIYPKALLFKLAYYGLLPVPAPITLTFSVTNLCQSRCKTCRIWQIYPQKQRVRGDELSLEEIRRIFKSLGRKIYFFNISGGEPFLREDLAEIIESAVDFLNPSIVHIPTNALASDRVVSQAEKILQILESKNQKIPLTIKPSIDGVGELHDFIRGVSGNWDKLQKTIAGLKELEKKYSRFHLELGTVVSNFNKDHLGEIEDYVYEQGVQSYRNEIAEQREEFLNIGDPITPTGDEYAELMRGFSKKVRSNLHKKRRLARTTESLRLVYYELAAEIVKQNRQVIPCYGGISNVHLTPYGDLWPCCVLGYSKPLGNLRDADYDFWSVWRGPDARGVRQYIKDRNCACPLANQAYSNIICDVRSLLKVFRVMFCPEFCVSDKKERAAL